MLKNTEKIVNYILGNPVSPLRIIHYVKGHLKHRVNGIHIFIAITKPCAKKKIKIKSLNKHLLLTKTSTRFTE